MAKFQIAIGIDIGTDTIKILAVKKDIESGRVSDIIFMDRVKSAGVQKGRIKNVNEAAKKIKELLNRLDQSQENKKNKFSIDYYVSINGSKLQLLPSRGLIAITRADQRVSQGDIDRIFQIVRAINLQAANKEILEVFPKEWILDGERDVKDPLNLYGTRLELEAQLLSVFSSDLENAIAALKEADIDIDAENIIAAPLADACSVLTPQQKELGVVLINLGAATTSVSIYEEGKLLDLAVFPVGSANITNDIAIGFKTEIEVAEKIKKEYGICFINESGGDKKIEIDLDTFILDQEKKDNFEEAKIEWSNSNIKNKKNQSKVKKDKSHYLIFTKKSLKRIIEARVNEIYDLVNEEIKKVGKQGLLPGGIVLTGGGAKLPGMVELAKKEFNLPCRIGYPKSFNEQIMDPIFSTVCGLVIDNLEEEDGQIDNNGETTGLGKIFLKIGDFFRNLSP
ncbi:MAG TPA: cell division protein FtsA [Candidatus Pacearchaeota archaeon]|nr:cell division protein FtsA [Candidatus Pacearchaeota archaeon]HRR94687.1 cell division protein FtsA [Candidatus Paceibacterota bacterium]HPC30367.1 cell division protein FtsA [Candidatus Pacearchaeota archaeon]HQG09180.1 cell division protein FtsA [Candidatus Pacearchaeota archaeon]HQH20236.1 cell division protein FtsA [Candidatus Pacearchaeota archaeon]